MLRAARPAALAFLRGGSAAALPSRGLARGALRMLATQAPESGPKKTFLDSRYSREGAGVVRAPPGRHEGEERKRAPDLSAKEGRVTFAEYCPERLDLWHPEKNGNLSPYKASYRSHQQAWFKCDVAEDHEWQTSVCSMTAAAIPCPYCLGREASVTNNVRTTNPNAAELWHPTRNGDKTPDNTVARSTKKVWWKCPHGPDHEFQALVRAITVEGHSCPYCADRKVSVTNSMAERFPLAAKDWHPTLNGDKTPHDIVGRLTQSRYWFLCENGHELQMALRTRCSVKECPSCHKRGSSVDNCLPELLATVREEFVGSAECRDVEAALELSWDPVYEWRCQHNAAHANWHTSLYNRLALGSNCPECAGRTFSEERSLSSRFPQLAAEWHPTKNAPLTPEEITYGSVKKVWWQCSADPSHEWKVQVNKRTNNGRGCPQCSNLQVSATNNVAAVAPHLVPYWDVEKNELGPDQVISGSSLKIHWKCPEGPDHEWVESPKTRVVARHACLFCHGTKRSVTNTMGALHPDIVPLWDTAANGGVSAEDTFLTKSSKTVFHLNCPSCGFSWSDSNSQMQKRIKNGGRGCHCPRCYKRGVAELQRQYQAQKDPTGLGV